MSLSFYFFSLVSNMPTEFFKEHWSSDKWDNSHWDWSKIWNKIKLLSFKGKVDKTFTERYIEKFVRLNLTFFVASSWFSKSFHNSISVSQ